MPTHIVIIKFVAYIALCVAVVGVGTSITYKILIALSKRGYENE
jgi:hypothetical protein